MLNNLNFTISGDINNKYIVPGIIIILIEDVFYYNNLNSMMNSISLDLALMETSLEFTLSFKANTQINPVSLPPENNVGQILDLFYNNNHKLEFTTHDGIYNSILTLYDIDQKSNNFLS
jgi:hypothetical protein